MVQRRQLVAIHDSRECLRRGESEKSVPRPVEYHPATLAHRLTRQEQVNAGQVAGENGADQGRAAIAVGDLRRGATVQQVRHKLRMT